MTKSAPLDQIQQAQQAFCETFDRLTLTGADCMNELNGARAQTQRFTQQSDQENFPITTVAFVPPNPNEFDIATVISALRAT